MRALPWILGGGAGALAAYYWYRDRDASRQRADGHNGGTSSTNAASTPASQGSRPEPLPGRWVWPVGVWHDRKPEISDGFASKRRSPGGQLVTHGGVDIMYRRQPGDAWRAGTPNGSPGWVMPDHRAALAASDGVVWSATNTPRGWTVVIDHAPRHLATYYTHLSSLLVTAKQHVSAGTPLGIIGADPLDAEHLMHLHLEVWRGGASDRFDPQRLIETTWEYVPDPGDLPRELVARNGDHRRTDGTELPRELVARNGDHRRTDGTGYSVPVISHYRRPPRH